VVSQVDGHIEINVKFSLELSNEFEIGTNAQDSDNMMSVHKISKITADVAPREVKTRDADMEQSFAPRIDFALREQCEWLCQKMN
jgi:hypothetical protein